MNQPLFNFMIVFWVGLFFLTKEPVFLWLLAGCAVLLTSRKKKRKDPMSSSRSSQLWAQDARAQKVQVVDCPKVRLALEELYQMLAQTQRETLSLQNIYQDVIHEMWHELGKTRDPELWLDIIRQVIRGWPVESRQSHLQHKLTELQRLKGQWNEARSEAIGG
jgi:hypothetical protein